MKKFHPTFPKTKKPINVIFISNFFLFAFCFQVRRVSQTHDIKYFYKEKGLKLCRFSARLLCS